MRIVDFKRWHWIAIGLLVGLACGVVRQGNGPDVSIDDYDHLFTSAAQFENALTAMTRGQHMLNDIVVYPYHLHTTNGGDSLVYLVTGQYWDGKARAQDGVLVANYQTACFIARSPYTPTATGPGAHAGTTYPTVLDYLKSLGASGVKFHYAWWWPLTTPLALWLMGSLLVIGGVWPTAINLIAFGKFNRPREQFAVGLEGVKGTSSPPVNLPAEVDEGLLQELEKEVENATAADVPPAPAPPMPPSPPPALAAEPLEPAPIPADEHHPEFAAKRDDFYPTERRTHKPHSDE
jgi:hypothetical protein